MFLRFFQFESLEKELLKKGNDLKSADDNVEEIKKEMKTAQTKVILIILRFLFFISSIFYYVY